MSSSSTTKDLFDAAGLEYPQKDWGQEELIAAAKALTVDTDGDGKIDQFGYTFPWWPVVLEMYGASIWNEDATVCTLNSPEGVKAIQSIVDGRYADAYSPTADQLAEMGDWDMFVAGKLAMFPTGPWAVQPFNEKSLPSLMILLTCLLEINKPPMCTLIHTVCLQLLRTKTLPGDSLLSQPVLKVQRSARMANMRSLP